MMIAVLGSLWRAKRGEGRLRACQLPRPGVLLALFARRRRKMGFYDLRTLALYRAAWQRRGTPAALLEYVLYRRDLGYRLPKRWSTLLLAGLHHLRVAERRLALALVAETAPESLAQVPVRFLGQAAGRMAPLASWSRRLDGAAAPAWLARLEDRQMQWRDDFAELLRRTRSMGICVVGNGGNLKGAGRGDWIDSHGLVVRFNRFRCAESNVTDIGARTQIWVGAPGYSGAPPDQAEWVVISGPDMRFRRQNWEPQRDRLELDRPVLTVPLVLWRSLATSLCAPPSAGLLMLAWIRTMLGSWEGVVTVGMGVTPSADLPYHHADPAQKAVGRHNWGAERLLLGRWRDEGLRMR